MFLLWKNLACHTALQHCQPAPVSLDIVLITAHYGPAFGVDSCDQYLAESFDRIHQAQTPSSSLMSLDSKLP